MKSNNYNSMVQRLICIFFILIGCLCCTGIDTHAADVEPPKSTYDVNDGGTYTDDGRYYIFKYHLQLLSYDAPTGTAVYRLTQSFSIRNGNVNVMTDDIVLTNRNGARQPVGPFSSYNGSRSPGDYDRSEYYDITLTEGENKIIAKGSYTDGSGDAEFTITVNKFNNPPTVVGTNGTWMEGEVAKGTRTWQSVYTDGATGSEEGNKKQTSTGFMYYDEEEAPSGINAYGYNANNTTYDGNNTIYKNSGITGIYNSSGNVVNWTELNNPGTYTVYSHTTDSGTSEGTGSRTITVKENKKPVITAPNRSFYEGEHTAAYWTGTLRMSGVSATDNEDGALAASKIKIKSDNVNVNKAGTYQVIYEVSDSMGKVGTATSTVTVKTNHAPVITANNQTFYEAQYTQSQWRNTLKYSGMSATDTEDGNLTSKVSIEENVNVMKPGAYPVKYSVTDAYGKTTSKTVTITVKYNNPPVITAGNQSFYEGQYDLDQWKEDLLMKNVSAVDTEDGDMTTKISVIQDNVDPKTPGTYPVIYSVSDKWGKTTTKQVTITVKFNNPPVIKVNDLSFFENEYTAEEWHDTLRWTDLVATDKEDGTLTDKVEIIEDTVITDVAGVYKVVYRVNDQWGKGASKEIKVTIKYNNAPVITAPDKTYYENEITAKEWHDTLRMEDVESVDKEDGDLTENIKIVKDDVNVKVPGTYHIKYQVTDSYGKTTEKQSDITIKFNNSPIIDVTSLVVKEGEYDEDAILKLLQEAAESDDIEDGTLTSKTKIIKNDVDPKTPGTYEVTYQVTDKYGKTTIKTINVDVVENQKPVLQIFAPSKRFIEGQYTVEEWQELRMEKVIAHDREDTDLTDKIEIISDDTDPASSGEYTVAYKVTDKWGKSEQKTAKVTVEPNLAPVIYATDKWYKDTDIITETELMKDVYAFDDHDGEITDQIMIASSNVQSGVAGSYNVTYKVSDQFGKVSAKTVAVYIEAPGTKPTDPEPPIITDPDAIKLWNGRDLAKVNVTKLMEDSIFDHADAYTHVVFGVYAAEDIVYKDEAVLSKDSLIAITRIDQDGQIHASLYHKGTYYLQELKTDNHYELSDMKYFFEFK